MTLFDECKAVRNKLAHEPPAIVIEGVKMSLLREFGHVLQLLKKIELWWIVHVEMAVSGNVDSEQIDIEKIVPGSILMHQIMLDVIAGNEELSKHDKDAAKPQ